MSFRGMQALLFRTDFSDEAAWQKVLGAVRAQALEETRLRIIEDRSTFDGSTAEDLLRTGIGLGRPMLFLADAQTMMAGSLLSVDLVGTQRRVAATQINEVLNGAPSGMLAFAQIVGKLFETTDRGVRFKADSMWGPGEAAAEVDEPSPLVRTDFSNAAAWQATLDIIRTSGSDEFPVDLAIIDDRRFEGMKPTDIPREVLGRDVVTLYIADAGTMTDPERPILCVDLFGEGGEFRCSAKELPGVVVNLSLGNVDFFELADAVDADGIYRGS